MGTKVLTDNVVTNLQAQIDELKTSDGIGVPQTISEIFGLPTAATVSDVIRALNTKDQSIIEAIKDSSKFINTHNYTNSGTYTFTAQGTKGFAIIIGGGGGGTNGELGSKLNGGSGGGYGNIVVTSIINISRGTSYTAVVGSGGSANSNGGTSSCFGSTAEGGSRYGGGSYGNGGSYGRGSDGGDGASTSKTSSVGTFTVASGGGGGGGGHQAGRGTVYGGTGGHGGANGGNGGKATSKYNSSTGDDILTAENGQPGEDGVSYGDGGGGGGGGGHASGEYDDKYGSGGRGGSGKNGEVIIYESGVFNI